jgi:isoleucyl-tRNA synthetase
MWLFLMYNDNLNGVIMKYESGTRRKAIVYEKDLIKYWNENNIFEKSVDQRPEDNPWVFYDGPPFITGEPHHGNLLTLVVKDAIPRFWTMQGKRVERVWGCDCHSLPAEVFTEKKLGIKDKRYIGTKITREEYITTCRDNMVETGSL